MEKTKQTPGHQEMILLIERLQKEDKEKRKKEKQKAYHIEVSAKMLRQLQRSKAHTKQKSKELIR